MSSPSAVCPRCNRAVAPDPSGEIAYCADCTKMLERDALRQWATQWAASLCAPEQAEYFFTVLAAAWEQGFTKARDFTDTLPSYDLQDNPFKPESANRDPLRARNAHRNVQE